MLDSIFNKVAGTLLKRDSNVGLICKCCKICKNIYFEKHLRIAASEFSWSDTSSEFFPKGFSALNEPHYEQNISDNKNIRAQSSYPL